LRRYFYRKKALENPPNILEGKKNFLFVCVNYAIFAYPDRFSKNVNDSSLSEKSKSFSVYNKSKNDSV
jgi:hypothetical protein